MRRRNRFGLLFGLVGVVLAGIQVVQALQVSGSTLDLAFNAFPFGLMALALSYTGYWLSGTRTYRDDLPVIAAWGVGGAVALVSVTALVLFSQPVSPTTLEKAPHAAVDNLTVGALAGVMVGLYDARGRHRLRELQVQRDRVEAFANRAADMNNYGRVLNQCDTVDDVSALCIEAVETLVGISGSAFVAPTDRGVEPVHNTMTEIDESAIVALARRATEGQVASVVEHTADLPDGIDPAAMSAYTILVVELVEGPVAIVALARAGDEPAEEDIDLLEMLVTHASTSIRNINETPAARS